MTGISKVLITGGRETGGLQSFATTLAGGFAEIGIPAEVIRPGEIYWRWSELRNRKVLKILSTTAVFAAPFCRRVICVAHGFPRADAQGWLTVSALIASFKLASLSTQTHTVAISHYAASHLKAIYNIEIDGVIHNPLNPIFFEPAEHVSERIYLTYVGRLHPVKNIDKLLPAMQAAINENSDRSVELRICIVGDGPLRQDLQDRFGKDPRVEFTGGLDVHAVREILRKTKVFISACETEGLGIAYLEALSQGCAVVMPACGGGLEITPDRIGTQIQLMPLTFERDSVENAIRRAFKYVGSDGFLNHYSPEMVASEYLKFASGRQQPLESQASHHHSMNSDPA